MVVVFLDNIKGYMVDLGVGVGIVGFCVVVCLLVINVIFVEIDCMVFDFVYFGLKDLDNVVFVSRVKVLEVDIIVKGSLCYVVGLILGMVDYVIMNLLYYEFD